MVQLEVLGKLPDITELENPESQIASEVFSTDEVLLGKIFTQNRSNVNYDRLPDHLVKALLATEDVRFRKHAGVDVRGTIRAVAYLGRKGGASTITQQLAKNLFHTRPSSSFARITQKLKEWNIAIKLERLYTKNEIAAFYLNTVEFVHGAFGIKSCAKTYFNKEVEDLSIEEAAVIVGMLKNPSRLNPKSHPNDSKKRRNVVIRQMEKYDFITSAVADSLVQMPIQLEFAQTDHNSGLATYLREQIKMELKKWTNDNPKVNGEKYDIYRDGLKIHTTIDSKMQAHAEAAVTEHLTEHQKKLFKQYKDKDPYKGFEILWENIVKNQPRYKYYRTQGMNHDEAKAEMEKPIQMTVFTWKGEKDTLMSPMDSIRHHRMHLQAGFMVMDPKTGEIKAWVGGANHKYFKYDHVHKQATRQIGSTFKPFLYSVAIDNGYSPCFEVLDIQHCIEANKKLWCPKNSDNEYSGTKFTLYKGLQTSTNSISAYLMKEIGPVPVANQAKRMGITSTIDPVPSIALGTPDVSVIEMVGAYSAFANKGVYTKPIFIARIEDKYGNVLQDFTTEKTDVLSEQTAYIMTKMLRNVIDGGTGVRVRYKYGLEGQIAGKTGTTDDHSDGWFIGMYPQLIGGVWVGCDDRFIRFRGITNGQGASMALPIWAKFFKKIQADESIDFDMNAAFPSPDGPINIELDCSKFNASIDDPVFDDQPQSNDEYYGDEFEQ